MITYDNTIIIKESISDCLAIRSSVKQLFKNIESLPASAITIDFKDVQFMNRSFAHEYLIQKNHINKKILEINKSQNIVKMFSVVENSSEEKEHIVGTPVISI